MRYSALIKKAIRFSIKTHEVYQKQKRKGKDIPYITHPLAVGLIIAGAGGSDEVVAAGLLHDTIEDSPKDKKVTKGMLEERFGPVVAGLVGDVTEDDKALTWKERKREALGRIPKFSKEAVLVKSADVLANACELVDDHRDVGEAVFERFHASKADTLAHYLSVIEALLARFPESPISGDLSEAAAELRRIAETSQ